MNPMSKYGYVQCTDIDNQISEKVTVLNFRHIYDKSMQVIHFIV